MCNKSFENFLLHKSPQWHSSKNGCGGAVCTLNSTTQLMGAISPSQATTPLWICRYSTLGMETTRNIRSRRDLTFVWAVRRDMRLSMVGILAPVPCSRSIAPTAVFPEETSRSQIMFLREETPRARLSRRIIISLAVPLPRRTAGIDNRGLRRGLCRRSYGHILVPLELANYVFAYKISGQSALRRHLTKAWR